VGFPVDQADACTTRLFFAAPDVFAVIVRADDDLRGKTHAAIETRGLP
jgi:hypothetical protein